MRDIVRYVVVLTTVCVVAASALAVVYAVTKGPIAEAERQEKLKAIREVLNPKPENSPDEDTFESPTAKTFYQGRNAAKELTGLALAVTSPDGYSGNIDLMMGINPSDGKITGIYVLKHLETPGLGSKIKDDSFQGQFIGKAIIAGQGESDPNFIVKKDGGSVEAISGATISSRAVAKALRGGLESFNKEYGGNGGGSAPPAERGTAEGPERREGS